MIKHVVFFRFKKEHPEAAEKAKELLLAMKGRVPQLVDIEAGTDIIHSERSFDLALVTTFHSLADLDGYQVHPVHKEVAQYIASVRESSASVDYEY